MKLFPSIYKICCFYYVPLRYVRVVFAAWNSCCCWCLVVLFFFLRFYKWLYVLLPNWKKIGRFSHSVSLHPVRKSYIWFHVAMMRSILTSICANKLMFVWVFRHISLIILCLHLPAVFFTFLLSPFFPLLFHHFIFSMCTHQRFNSR